MWCIVLICVLIFAILVILSINNHKFNFYKGGDEKHKNIVVDTLNMTHEIFGKSVDKYHISNPDILNTIRIVTDKMKTNVSDKLIFITKTNKKDNEYYNEMELFNKLSKELGVYIFVVNELKKPSANSFVKIHKSHSTLGRDDFYIMITAWKLRCPVLGQDYYRDLKNMKFGELDSFYVEKYSPYKTFPDRDYINPTGQEYKRMRAPRVIRWDSL
jgi:hypothetical protein